MMCCRYMHRTVIGEERLLGFFQTFGENVKTWGGETNRRYVTGPWERKDNVQKIAGPIGAVGSTILEFPDYLYAGIVDQRITPASGIAGRTRRDIGLLAKNVVTLHPLRAGGDAFRLAFSDVPLDAFDVLGGFHSTQSYATANASPALYSTETAAMNTPLRPERTASHAIPAARHATRRNVRHVISKDHESHFALAP